jgi:acyl-coenzyme A synthetase/AMP-(fatty) acid ligase
VSGPATAGPATIADALRRFARERPAARALVAEHRTVGYAELASRVGACAAALASRGVVRGECVGVSIADELAHAIVALALASIGAPYVVLPTFEDVAARVRLAARVGARRIVAARDDHRIAGLPLVAIDAAAAVDADEPHAMPAAPGDPDALLTWFSTSGTTGEAKLIPVTHGRLALQARRIPAVTTMPLSSIEYHYAQRMLHGLVVQGATYAIRGRTRTPVARLCEALGVDVVLGMPSQARTLLGEAAVHGRLPSRTTVRTAGARASARFRREMLASLCDAFDVLYAAQECGQIAHVVERDPARVTESVGRLQPGVEVQVVDAAGVPLPPGEIGEIRMRAPGMAPGYHDDPAATARHFRDGWFQPGDAASLTADGELHVFGRADDVMNLNGIKIAPLEIERALERHPAVKAVVAFPLRSAVHGDVPVAAVQLVEGAAADERALQAYAREALGLRAPRRVTIVREMPTTPQGKVDVKRLAAAMRPDAG